MELHPLHSGEEADEERRAFLAAATVAVGAAGLAFASIPFIASWLPSERARALGAPVRMNTQGIEPGTLTLFSWRKKPIVVVNRTPAMLERLSNHDTKLKDPRSLDSEQPQYAHNDQRSRRADLFVAIGVCTHLGCLPKARLQAGEAGMGADWPGGFYCPCHGSRFDLAGRVFKGSPASSNLVIPPYASTGRSEIVIGVDEVSA